MGTSNTLVEVPVEVLSNGTHAAPMPPHLLGSQDRAIVAKDVMQLDLLAMNPLAVAASFDASVRAKALEKLRLPDRAASTSDGRAKSEIKWHRVHPNGNTNKMEPTEDDSSDRRILDDLVNDGRFVTSCEIRQQLDQVDDAS